MVETTETMDMQENEGRKNGQGSIVLSGTKYAVGLLWAPLQNPDDPLPEIREAMEAEGDTDLYCQRASATAQYGLGRTSMGHVSGEPSLAASVASALSDKTSVCGVFKVDEGWWFIAIRNDLILAEEDVLFETEEEAKRAFFAMMAVPDWDMRIVPPEWNVEDSVQVSLVELVQNTRKTRLFELSAAKKTQILVILAIVVVSLLGGLFYVAFSFLADVLKEQPFVQVATPPPVTVQEPTPEKPKPWERVPDTLMFLNRCWNNSYQLDSMTIPGWQMGKVTCTPQKIETNWRLTEGRIAWLKAALNEYTIDRKVKVVADKSGNSAKATIDFSDIPLVESKPTLKPEQLQEQLVDIQQATKIPIQFSEQTIVDPPNNPDGSAPVNQQVYTYFSFSVSSAYSPWEWKVFFDKFSGLELLKVEFDPTIGSNNKWTYEGRIYAN